MEDTISEASGSSAPERTDVCDYKRICFLAIVIPLAIFVFGGSAYLWKTDVITLHVVGLAWAGFASSVAIWLSFSLIYLHITCMPNNEPVPLQQKIIRIILMVPLYALGSWLSLVFVGYGLYIDLVRDIYESYVIYTFFTYLIDLTGGEDACVLAFRTYDEGVGVGCLRHPFPLCYVSPVKLGARFLQRCRRFVIQYVLVKPICSALAIWLAVKGQYHDGKIHMQDAYLYVTFTVNLSVLFAFTALFYFYCASRQVLAPHKPLGKFLCVKAIIFLSFWQVLLAMTINVTVSPVHEG